MTSGKKVRLIAGASIGAAAAIALRRRWSGSDGDEPTGPSAEASPAVGEDVSGEAAPPADAPPGFLRRLLRRLDS